MFLAVSFIASQLRSYVAPSIMRVYTAIKLSYVYIAMYVAMRNFVET